MKFTATVCFFLFFFTNLSAQVQFQKGYIIKNNQEIECLIKNNDWTGLPLEIEYRESDTAKIKKANVEDINGFKIYNTNHYYKKYTFSINENDDSNNVNTKTITSFLNVLVEGHVNLFQYKGYAFFYEINNSGDVKQLLYKKSKNFENKTVEDYTFRKQIFDNLNYEGNSINIRTLKYIKNDLINYFIEYNKNQNSTYINYNAYKRKIKINFSPFVGIGFTNKRNDIMLYKPSTTTFVPSAQQGVVIPSSIKSVEIDFGTSLSPVIGFEVEALLPINRNKWAFFINPNLNWVKGNSFENLEYRNRNSYFKDIELSNFLLIDVPVGLRYYFYLNTSSKIHIDIAYDFLLNDKKNTPTFRDSYFEYNPDAKKIKSNFTVSAGYSFNKKYDVSINYLNYTNTQNNYSDSKMSCLSFRLKYTIN
ncbi:hypothetical protein [Flavobacterium sp. J27]|uniref:hypothetical protein n=1 Tax=Flavobacterium sp. J27 TaxID=2060419 RepID=UPI0010311159|nr:hypothetical protein [Flavobacterium sp. J27]